jgi:flagellar biosynthetic protein FliP
LAQAAHGGDTARIAEITALITALALAPSIIVMMTAFTRIIIVLSLLRSAIGAQGTPPNIVLIGIALFLTYFVMEPTLTQAWNDGILPMQQGTLDPIAGIAKVAAPFRVFMLANTQAPDISLYLQLGHMPVPPTANDVPWRALIPAFATGELRRAFEMGFLLYLPFMVIDLVVASVLMALGMVMLPPTSISLPFKLIFFVMVDGWRLATSGLAESFLRH